MPLVLIVPGLPGTKLGQGGEELWFDVSKARRGGLLNLAYQPGATPLDTLGVFNSVYGQLDVRLRFSGFDVAVHAFDWRRPLAELGDELAARVAAAPGEVHVVAHSMGGLVARAAIHRGAPNLRKVIMLGTPNHGTFAVVQGIRGAHWMLHAVSALDAQHTAAELAARVFSTWPSIYPQIPVPAADGDVDLRRLASWPAGPGPRPELLEATSSVDAWRATEGDFHVIAGYGVSTVLRVVPHGSGFEYVQSDGGDGWVSTGRARLEGRPCHYVECGHLAMPNHNDVIEAVDQNPPRRRAHRARARAPGAGAAALVLRRHRAPRPLRRAPWPPESPRPTWRRRWRRSSPEAPRLAPAGSPAPADPCWGGRRAGPPCIYSPASRSPLRSCRGP